MFIFLDFCKVLIFNCLFNTHRFIFSLQDNELSWATTNPDFTFCFQQTTLVYVPCAILWLFAPLEVYKLKRSRYSDIPWSMLNTAKTLILFLLIALTFVDLSMGIYSRESQGLFPVHIVTPIVKIVSFVSTIEKTNCTSYDYSFFCFL
jgi:hypothetical protein